MLMLEVWQLLRGYCRALTSREYVGSRKRHSNAAARGTVSHEPQDVLLRRWALGNDVRVVARRRCGAWIYVAIARRKVVLTAVVVVLADGEIRGATRIVVSISGTTFLVEQTEAH